jgi:RNA-binding motif X-linked protein 2
MNEGDIAIVFSEFGEIVDLRLARDKITGKSKGFAFLAYQDQRSTVIAVDNFNGAEICGRTLRVDHVRKYKPPKEFMEVSEGFNTEDYRPTGPDGRGWGKYRNHTQEEVNSLEGYSR